MYHTRKETIFCLTHSLASSVGPKAVLLPPLTGLPMGPRFLCEFYLPTCSQFHVAFSGALTCLCSRETGGKTKRLRENKNCVIDLRLGPEPIFRVFISCHWGKQLKPGVGTHTYTPARRRLRQEDLQVKASPGQQQRGQQKDSGLSGLTEGFSG